jgi:hypothetical protein
VLKVVAAHLLMAESNAAMAEAEVFVDEAQLEKERTMQTTALWMHKEEEQFSLVGLESCLAWRKVWAKNKRAVVNTVAAMQEVAQEVRRVSATEPGVDQDDALKAVNIKAAIASVHCAVNEAEVAQTAAMCLESEVQGTTDMVINAALSQKTSCYLNLAELAQEGVDLAKEKAHMVTMGCTTLELEQVNAKLERHLRKQASAYTAAAYADRKLATAEIAHNKKSMAYGMGLRF